MAFQRLVQIHGHIPGDLVAVADVVEVTIVLHELIGQLLDAMQVEEVSDRAFLEDHLAVRVKVIVALEHRRAVGIGYALQHLVQVHSRVSHDLAAVTDVVVIAFIHTDLVSLHL